MTIRIGDIVRVHLAQYLDGQLVLNVLHYVCTGEDVSIGEDILNSWVGNNIIPQLLACQSSNILLTGINTQKIHPLPATVPIASTAFNGTGTNVGASLPTEVCVCYTKQTTFAGRKFRGRFYLGGLPTAFVEGSVVLAAHDNIMNALATKLYLGVVVAGSSWRFAPCLFHRADKTYTGLTNVRYNNVIRSQRRRQIGKGV
jgi:hypothetical protein